MKKLLIVSAITLFTATAALANTGICTTQKPPKPPAGWTYKGKVCKIVGEYCGGACVCATAYATDLRTKTRTYSCPCQGPEARMVDLDGVPASGTALFSYSVSPIVTENFLALVHGLESGEGLGPESLAGMIATVQLMLMDGQAIAADSAPLEGGSLDFGIEVPDIPSEQIAGYTFTLGQYTDVGSLE